MFKNGTVVVALLAVLSALSVGCAPSEPADEDWDRWMADGRHHGPMMNAMMHDEAFMNQWTERMASNPELMHRMMGDMMHDEETMDLMMDEMVSDPQLRDEMVRHMSDHRDEWADIMTEMSQDREWCEELIRACKERPSADEPSDPGAL